MNSDMVSSQYMDPMSQPRAAHAAYAAGGGGGAGGWHNIGSIGSPVHQMYDEYLTLDGQPLMSPIMGAMGGGQYRTPTAGAVPSHMSYAQPDPIFPGGATLGLAALAEQDDDYFSHALLNNPVVALNVSPEAIPDDDDDGNTGAADGGSEGSGGSGSRTPTASPTNAEGAMGTPRPKSVLGSILSNPSAVVAGGLHGTISAKPGKRKSTRGAAATAWQDADTPQDGGLTPNSVSSAEFGDGGGGIVGTKTNQTPTAKAAAIPKAKAKTKPVAATHATNPPAAKPMFENVSQFNIGGITWDDLPEIDPNDVGADYRAVGGADDISPMKQHFYPSTNTAGPAAFVPTHNN